MKAKMKVGICNVRAVTHADNIPESSIECFSQFSEEFRQVACFAGVVGGLLLGNIGHKEKTVLRQLRHGGE